MSSHRDQSVLPSPSGPVLCATGCGFFGNPNTDNLCSKCNADRKRQQATSSSSSPAVIPTTSISTSSPSPAITSTPSTPPTPSIAPLAITDSPSQATITSSSTSTSTAPTMMLDTNTSPAPTTITPATSISPATTEAPTTTPKKKFNRCGICSKKVGITYFNCRCDETLLLCSAHRLPHQHDCKFDVKKLHAANLTKANPEIIRAKMEKI